MASRRPRAPRRIHHNPAQAEWASFPWPRKIRGFSREDGRTGTGPLSFLYAGGDGSIEVRYHNHDSGRFFYVEEHPSRPQLVVYEGYGKDAHPVGSFEEALTLGIQLASKKPRRTRARRNSGDSTQQFKQFSWPRGLHTPIGPMTYDGIEDYGGGYVVVGYSNRRGYLLISHTTGRPIDVDLTEGYGEAGELIGEGKATSPADAVKIAETMDVLDDTEY